jgi:hypothetical protein
MRVRESSRECMYGRATNCVCVTRTSKETERHERTDLKRNDGRDKDDHEKKARIRPEHGRCKKKKKTLHSSCAHQLDSIACLVFFDGQEEQRTSLSTREQEQQVTPKTSLTFDRVFFLRVARAPVLESVRERVSFNVVEVPRGRFGSASGEG